MSFPAGKRDRRITIQVNEPASQDSAGHNIDNFVDLATVWASYLPFSPGSEPYTADQFAAFVDAEFEVLYRADFLNLNPALHRILFDGRTYNILGVTETERRAKLRIVAKARAEAGAPAA